MEQPKIKLVVVTGIYGRPEIFDFFAKGVKILRHKGLDIECVVAGSEGKQSRDLVEEHNFHYIEIANQPLATKMNATLLKAKGLQRPNSQTLLKEYYKEQDSLEKRLTSAFTTCWPDRRRGSRLHWRYFNN